MTITETEYLNLKEYWDYQRLKEYNREKVYEHAEELLKDLEDKLGEAPTSVDAIFDDIWAQLPESEWLTPIPYGWVPKDPKYQLWNE